MSARIKTVPRHIAIIMDGNGRWAKLRGFSRIKGHEAGAQAVRKFLKEKTPELLEKNVRLQAIGRLTDLPQSAQERLHTTIEQTAGNTGLTLILALSYGGRLEIIDGIKSLLRAIELGHIDKAMVDVEMFSKHLYTRYYPDPDLLIRTSGEMRLSNFLLWQTSYTELYITPKLWPDFTKEDLFAAVEEFGRRQRRYGAVE